MLISEIIGNEPLGERVLETTMDAMKRLLKPTARLVPNKVKIFGLPVTIPFTELAKYTFVPETLRDWQSWYDIDFNPLAEASRNSSQSFFINPSLARDWESLCEPVQLAVVDLKGMSQLSIDNTRTRHRQCFRAVGWCACLFRNRTWANDTVINTSCTGS